jgi:hypothetical protein
MALCLAEKTRVSLYYWSGGSPSRSKAAGFKTIMVYCMGRPVGPSCCQSAQPGLDDVLDWDWYDICAHLKCSECSSVGWVDPRSELERFDRLQQRRQLITP